LVNGFTSAPQQAQTNPVFSDFLLTPNLLIFEFSNIGRRGSVRSQRYTLSGLNGREADSPLPSWGGEYFRFLLQRGIFHPLIRTGSGFASLYRAMYGGFNHHPAVGVIPFHRQPASSPVSM